MTEYVGVRFQKLGKLYHFRLREDDCGVEPGDLVFIETNGGRLLGLVMSLVDP
jgi:hypothetical protein